MTMPEVIETTGIKDSRTRYALWKLHQQGLVHICGWVVWLCQAGKNRTTPQFAAGKRHDEFPPPGIKCKGFDLRKQPSGSQLLADTMMKWINHA